MPRNLDNRVELVAPVEDPPLRDELLDVLERCLADNSNAWEARCRRAVATTQRAAGEQRRNVQEELIEQHLRRANDFSA